MISVMKRAVVNPVILGKIWQNGLAPLNHSLKINILWFQLVYDIENLNSQSAPDFDLI
jgi:hypothetical protein